MPPPQEETVQSLQKNDYVTCCFDSFWWVTLIEMVNSAEKDYLCTFLHPHGPSTQFHWPRGNDNGYVPVTKIIMKIGIPTTSVNGRTYYITEDERKKHRTALRLWINHTSETKFLIFHARKGFGNGPLGGPKWCILHGVQVLNLYFWLLWPLNLAWVNFKHQLTNRTLPISSSTKRTGLRFRTLKRTKIANFGHQK